METTLASDTLKALLPEWEALLQGWALDGSLTAAAQEALILEGTPEALQALVTQWSAGDFSALPPIVLLSAADINGALGAYAISTGTIYLNANWLETASKEQVFSVLTEELGHYLDGLLNEVDTPGDEGEYFLRLLSLAHLSNREKTDIRGQDDLMEISTCGKSIAAESSSTPQEEQGVNTYQIARLFEDLNPGGGSSSPFQYTTYGSKLLFSANDGTAGRELWQADINTIGLVQDIAPGPATLNPNDLKVAGSYLYFKTMASGSFDNQELWFYDGTSAYMINRSWPKINDAPRHLTAYKTKPYFVANDGTGSKLWYADGSQTGVIAGITSAVNGGPFPQNLSIIGKYLYFTAYSSSGGYELWRYDGTSAVRAQPKGINDLDWNSMRDSAVVGSSLYFSANNQNQTFQNYELWKTDGYSTSRVFDIYPGCNGSWPTGLISDGSILYFSADDGVNGRELWKAEGNNVTLVKYIMVGIGSSNPEPLGFINNILYFTADDGIIGRELWKTDGVSTELVHDIQLGGTSSNPQGQAIIGETLYFSADDGIHGLELWKTDGTNTTLVRDIFLGSASSNPDRFHVFDSFVFSEPMTA